jgi:hypothetical protein
MLVIPFSVILLPYAAAVAFIGLMSIINIWHLVRYGATTGVSYVVTLLFLVGGASILFTTWFALRGTDWTQTITLSLPNMSLSETKISL